MAGSWCVHHNQRFLVFSLLFICALKHSLAIEEFLLTCGGKIDLVSTTRIHSGILKVDMPKDFSQYQGKSTVQRDCEISIDFPNGLGLQIELYYLDIMPISSDLTQCSTGLEVFDGQRDIYGGRQCREGWKWEKEHREKKQEKKVIHNSPVVFRLVSEGPYKGTGFKVHFNQFRPTLPCNNHREFRCERKQRCVHDDITCDGWDDCGDDSDEGEDAGCELFTVSEIFAIIIGVFLVVGTVAATVVFLIKYRRIIRRDRLQRKESKLVLEEERRSMQAPSVVFPHRFNSMESVNKSHYSRKMDVESLMDRMELDKADKYSCKDNMSERSYKSASRRNRMTSQSSLAKEKASYVNNSKQDLNADRGSEKRQRGRSGREDDRESEKMNKERRYTDDDDYDSEEERRRRRRRSRDRRRYDRSDDEDYDSDYERRRRKSRDRDRYDSEDEDDSDRDRRRRRRRRYYDSDEDYDSDKDSRRRRRSRRRYDSDDDSDSERRRSSSKKSLNGEGTNDDDDDKDSRRRRRSRDRRKYDSDDDYDSDRDRRRRRRRDSDEYDSDRDRRRRRSRDRRSRDLSDEKIDKEQVKPVQSSSPDKSDKYQEPKGRQNENPYPAQSSKEQPNSSFEKSNPNPYKQPYPEKEKQVGKPREQEGNNYFSPPPSYAHVDKMPPKQEPSSFSPPPSVQEERPRYSRRTPRSNGVSPAQPTEPSGGNAWVPRSERKRNRRSRGDLAQNDDGDVYEDVVPKVHLENLGFREESV